MEKDYPTADLAPMSRCFGYTIEDDSGFEIQIVSKQAFVHALTRSSIEHGFAHSEDTIG